MLPIYKRQACACISVNDCEVIFAVGACCTGMCACIWIHANVKYKYDSVTEGRKYEGGMTYEGAWERSMQLSAMNNIIGEGEVLTPFLPPPPPPPPPP